MKYQEYIRLFLFALNVWSKDVFLKLIFQLWCIPYWLDQLLQEFVSIVDSEARVFITLVLLQVKIPTDTHEEMKLLSIVCFSLKKNNSCRQLKCNYLNVDLSWSETSYSGITRNAKRDFNKLLTTIKAEKLFFPTMLGIMRHDTETEHKLLTMDETCVHLVWPQIKKNCLCTIENLRLPNTCEVITFREYRILMEKLWWLFL